MKTFFANMTRSLFATWLFMIYMFLFIIIFPLLSNIETFYLLCYGFLIVLFISFVVLPLNFAYSLFKQGILWQTIQKQIDETLEGIAMFLWVIFYLAVVGYLIYFGLWVLTLPFHSNL